MPTMLRPPTSSNAASVVSADRVRRALAALEAAREHTLAIIAPLSDADAAAQHDALMSPIIWDLGHIAAFENLWLLRNTAGPIEFSEMPGTYDPFAHPRATRGALALPTLDEARTELARVRDEVRRRLADTSFDAESPLLRDGYVVRMVAQHESQHQETILQTLQLKSGAPFAAPRAWDTPRGHLLANEGAMVRCAGGRVLIGTDDRAESYDNERPRHEIELAPFWIDVTPVTNGAFLRFVEDGGYDDRSLWSDAGWTWRNESGARAPKHWQRGEAGWSARSMDLVAALDPLRPVCHVCFHEAEAYARFAGKRLLTEQEWEVAATWDPAANRSRAYPWGDERPTPALANVDQLSFQTAQIGAYERNVSPIGCYGMIGDVWEWTSTDFAGYAGFETFPYAEYSEVFFGSDYKVLRGGSWA
ncbi:MAG: SUMF1/EgtB/PvdO family nonheme iron enzyme, partial [Gemmatimonadota bacterium]|nr:SUMF1/EgtB/PvdO family nonheme iron enzyme [Gemmatimonadota bacterium]